MTELDIAHPTHAPVWVWGAGLGAAALGYMYFRSSRAAAASVTPVDAMGGTSGSLSGLGYSDATGVPVLGPGVTQPSGGTSSPSGSTTDPMYTSNQTWESAALTKLAGMGHSPLDIQTALETYLSGGHLTYPQEVLVNAAVQLFGLPPQGTMATPTYDPAPHPTPAPTHAPTPTTPKPSPAPKSAPHPVPAHAPSPYIATYTVQSGDTLSGIALHFYGHGTPYYYLKIARANGIVNPNAIRKGQTLRIPR